MNKKRIIIILGAVFGVIVLCVGGIFFYGYASAKAFEEGMAAYQSGDCAAATETLGRVTGFYRLAAGQNAGVAEQTIEECGYLLYAQESIAAGDHVAALSSYSAYLEAYPGSPISQYVIDLAFTDYQNWAWELRVDGEYAQAIEKYTTSLNTYPYANGVASVPETLGETYLEWAADLRQKGEYETAAEKCALVLTGYPDPDIQKRAGEEMGAIYTAWAGHLQTQGNYSEALAVLGDMQRDYPDIPASLAADGSIGGVLVNWAAALRESNDFEQAVEKYNLVLDIYGDTPAAEQAKTQLPMTYLEWGAYLQENGDSSGAIKVLETLVNKYPSSPSAAEARSILAQSYLDKGASLVNNHRYNEAMTAYQNAQSYADDAAVRAQAEAGIQQVIAALAHDTGSEGQELLEDTLALVCDEKPKTSPAVNFNTEEDGRFLICPNEAPDAFYLTEDLEAQYPGHFRYVIKVKAIATTVASIRFTGGHILQVQRVDWVVMVYSVETGKLLQQKTFLGPNPTYFPYYFSFSGTYGYWPGPNPDVGTILSWLNLTFE